MANKKFHYSGFGEMKKPSVEALGHTHSGSIGNLCTEKIREKMEKALF